MRQNHGFRRIIIFASLFSLLTHRALLFFLQLLEKEILLFYERKNEMKRESEKMNKRKKTERKQEREKEMRREAAEQEKRQKERREEMRERQIKQPNSTKSEQA